jgi:2-polyprenyl-6-hydroxyphenyl methylase/3-demethylubiquinone-9 3-methyltransferase
MSASDYHEQLWQAVPEGPTPPGLELRRAFLFERLRTAATVAASAHEGSQDARPERSLRVLDIGCGDGRLTAAIAQAGFVVVGIDVAEEPLRRARELHEGIDVRLVPADGEGPLADASFDVVWAGETIEHVTDTAGWLSELRRVLRSGGSLLLSTPAHDRLTLLSVALSSRRFDRRFDPRSDHVRFYTRRTLARLLADFGFEQIELRAAGGLPLARRTLLAAAVRSRF